MTEALTSIFPNALVVGAGVTCASSPFQNTWVLDFYDGALEGIARIEKSDRLIYFKTIWWDEYQDNRLFYGIIFHEDELKHSNSALHALIITALTSNSSLCGVTSVPTDTFEKLPKVDRVHLFCTQITSELFILPFASSPS